MAEKKKHSIWFWLIILGVLAVVLIAAIVFIFLKNGRKAV